MDYYNWKVRQLSTGETSEVANYIQLGSDLTNMEWHISDHT
jgi:hypothetical protein